MTHRLFELFIAFLAACAVGEFGSWVMNKIFPDE